MPLPCAARRALACVLESRSPRSARASGAIGGAWLSGPSRAPFPRASASLLLQSRTVYLLSGPKPRQPAAEPPSDDLLHEEITSSWADTDGLEALAKRAESVTLDASALTLYADGRMVRTAPPLDKASLISEYGLQARDLRQLDGVNVGTAPTLLVRKRSLIYSSALIRVLITKDKMVFLDDPTPPSSQDSTRTRQSAVNLARAVALYFRVLDAGTARRRARPVADNSGPLFGAEQPPLVGRRSPLTSPGPTAFEHRALEALLILLTRGYKRAFRKLEASAVEAIGDLSDISTASIRALTDTSRVVDSFVSRAQALQSTLASALHEDDDLSAMYLTAAAEGSPRGPQDHQEVELLLEHGLQRIDEVAQAAAQLAQRLKSADQHVALSLSATRNRLLLMEIRIALLMLSVTAGLSLATIFGSNLQNGLEQVPYGLYGMWATSIFITVIVGRAGFKALAHSRKSQAFLPGSEGVEARRRLEVLKRRQAAQAAQSASA